ncbi:60S ribosomal protein L23 [Capsicum annuum]|uniref:60S ribosomal protein L23 n=1 Tax=Capsicum annuum TaxID=4072 RepID=A0A2G2ZWU0_CAPAN|nr:60S ribosomal protein L23 [Capsicum annuum]PHT86416.1 60S ribosomal protein L23 [Capsicum annuum]
MSKRGRRGFAGNKFRMSLGLPVAATINCANNTRAKNLYIISVNGIGARLNRLPSAFVGDIVMATVKKGKPDLRKKVMPAVIISLRSAIIRPIGKECADLWPRIASVANAIVFEIDNGKALKSVLISVTSYMLGLFLISKAPWVSVQFHKSAGSSTAQLIGTSTPTLRDGVSSPSQYPTLDSPNSSFSSYDLEGYALNDPTVNRESLGTSYMDLIELQKAYLDMLLASQKSQYGLPYPRKSGGLINDYYGNPTLGLNMSYPGSPLAGVGLLNSPFRPGKPTSFRATRVSVLSYQRLKDMLFSSVRTSMGVGSLNKNLKTATTVEKNMVYQEIMPQALYLMTDVFGNYVIQKGEEALCKSKKRKIDLSKSIDKDVGSYRPYISASFEEISVKMMTIRELMSGLPIGPGGSSTTCYSYVAQTDYERVLEDQQE